MANGNGFLSMACGYDYYLRGYDDGVFGFTYIPSFTKKVEILGWLKGFREGKNNVERISIDRFNEEIVEELSKNGGVEMADLCTCGGKAFVERVGVKTIVRCSSCGNSVIAYNSRDEDAAKLWYSLVGDGQIDNYEPVGESIKMS